jgi:hypothetical protein
MQLLLILFQGTGETVTCLFWVCSYQQDPRPGIKALIHLQTKQTQISLMFYQCPASTTRRWPYQTRHHAVELPGPNDFEQAQQFWLLEN